MIRFILRIFMMWSLLLTGLISSCIIHAQSMELFAVSDLKRVFEDGYNLPPTYDTIKVFGIRGEIISGQFTIRTDKILTNVRVELSTMRNSVSETALPAHSVEWQFVGCVPLTTNARNQRPQDLVRKAPALFPDYLMTERSLTIKADSYKSVWLTINIPENAQAGKYNGKVTVKCHQGEESLPLVLTVYPLTLPSERNLNVAEWYDTRNFKKFHGIQEIYSEEWFSMLSVYAKNMTDHRQNVFMVPINTIEIRQSEHGKFVFDFTRFDQIAQVFWDTGKMDFLETGNGLTKFGEGGVVNSTEVLFNDLPVKNSKTGKVTMNPGKDILSFLLPAFEKHLLQKGWLDKTLIHVKDEPNLANSEAWREMSDYFHKYAPGIRRIDALANSHVIDKIEIAVPKLDKISPQYEVYRKYQTLGLEVWFYTVGIFQTNGYPNKTIDVPLMDNRIMHWINYRYDLNGFLHWGWNKWTDNPYEDVGMHIGDGWHVYPVKEGVINSLRWEQMRNGIQDYEYFRMLEDRIRELKDSLNIDLFRLNPSQRGKELSMLITPNFIKYDTNPDNLYNVKLKVIKELLELQNSPKLYVQTTPAEHSYIINREVVEVIGFAEPDSEVWVNGRKTSVSANGIFLMRTEGGKKDLEVIAKSPRGEAIATRHFNIVQ